MKKQRKSKRRPSGHRSMVRQRSSKAGTQRVSSKASAREPDDWGRCLAFARCGSDGKADFVPNSLHQQLERIRAFAESRQLNVIGEVTAVGSGVRQDHVAALLKRKLEHNDFDTLLIVDHTCLSRNDHHIRQRFEGVGARVVSVNSFSGAHHWLIKALLARAAEDERARRSHLIKQGIAAAKLRRAAR